MTTPKTVLIFTWSTFTQWCICPGLFQCLCTWVIKGAYTFSPSVMWSARLCLFPWKALVKCICIRLLKTVLLSITTIFRSRMVKEETAVKGELPIPTEIGQGAVGNRTGGRSAFHTPHWVWNGRRVQTQSSLCAPCYSGEKREGTDGKSKWMHH